MGDVWSELGQVMRWSECKTNSVNRFFMSRNMGVEYPHVMVIDIRKFMVIEVLIYIRGFSETPKLY